MVSSVSNHIDHFNGSISSLQIVNGNNKNDQNHIPSLTTLARKFFSDTPPFPKSLIPYRIIKLITNKWTFRFNKTAAEALIGKTYVNYNALNVVTSCPYTLCLLSVIFFGEPLAKKVIDHLREISILTVTQKLPSGNVWTYTIKDLFGGAILHNINHYPHDSLAEEQQKKKRNLLANIEFGFFWEKICNREPFQLAFKSQDDQEIITTIKNSFERLEYDFNSSTIELMRNEIIEKNSKVTFERSFVYCVAILGCKDDLDNRNFDHVFAIEQFLLEDQVRFRIYQSWIIKCTLSEDMKKKSYGESGEGCWDSKTILEFLDDLNALYCNQSGKTSTDSYEKCFGYEGERPPLLQFENDTLSGLSLRYFSSEINPEKCLDNLINFIDSHPSLYSSGTNMVRIEQV